MHFFSILGRHSSNILREQDKKTKKDEDKMMKNLNFIKNLGLKSRKYLESGNLTKFGELMNVHWEYKKGNHYIKYKAFYINAQESYSRVGGFNG